MKKLSWLDSDVIGGMVIFAVFLVVMGWLIKAVIHEINPPSTTVMERFCDDFCPECCVEIKK